MSWFFNPTLPGTPSGSTKPPSITTGISFQSYNANQPSTSSTSGSSGSSGGVPSWVSPSDAAFYNAVNSGWGQGHGGASIPQDQYSYFKQRADESAASGDPRDASYWGMRASGLYESPSSSSTSSSGSALTPYTAPDPFTFQSYSGPAPFTAPTMEEATADPGYQFALKQGQDALQASAAAKGTLLTGGTLKDITTYGQNAATQQYQNVYNRDYNTWQGNATTSLNDYVANENAALAAYQTNAGVSANAWSMNNTAAQQQIANLEYLATYGSGTSGIPTGTGTGTSTSTGTAPNGGLTPQAPSLSQSGTPVGYVPIGY